jgi:hypothetical protein
MAYVPREIRWKMRTANSHGNVDLRTPEGRRQDDLRMAREIRATFVRIGQSTEAIDVLIKRLTEK